MGLFAGTKWDVPAHCDRCGELESVCRCPPLPPAEPTRLPTGRQTAKLAIENRKRGAAVTVVRGLSPPDTDLKALLSQLQAACGAGGTIKDDTIELQGRHLERAGAFLFGLGYKVKGG